MRGREEETKELAQNFTHRYPVGAVVKNPSANAGNTWDMGSIPGSRRCLWSRKWQPTPVFLPGKSHGQRSLVCSPWNHKKFDLTERLSTHMCHKGQPSNSGSPYMCSLSWLFTSLQMKLEMKSMSIYFKEVLLSLSNMFWGSLTWKGLFWMGRSVSSVAQWCLTLCNPMDCSTPGFPVHHQLPDATQTHVHWVSDAIQPSHPLLSPCPPAFNLP